MELLAVVTVISPILVGLARTILIIKSPRLEEDSETIDSSGNNKVRINGTKRQGAGSPVGPVAAQSEMVSCQLKKMSLKEHLELKKVDLKNGKNISTPPSMKQRTKNSKGHSCMGGRGW